MTKHDFIRAIAECSPSYREAGLSKAVIEACLDALAHVAQVELGTEGGEIPLPGLGKIKATSRPARTARNPRTGESVEVPPKNGVRFKAGRDLLNALA
jgi:DNA-binding protein HU-beta